MTWFKTVILNVRGEVRMAAVATLRDHSGDSAHCPTPGQSVLLITDPGEAPGRGRGYSLRVTAPPALHQVALQHCAALVGDGSAARKAYRVYEDGSAAALPSS